MLLLALGLGATASRLLAKRPWLLGKLLWWTTAWVRPLTTRRGSEGGRQDADGAETIVDRRQLLVGSTATIAGLAAGVYGWQKFQEWRALAGLPDADPDRPNVLFIVLDTVRAQSLSLLGYHRPTTPHLEQLASQGVCFKRAIAPSSWTFPSHVTMFTGRMVHETKADFNVPFAGNYPTLAEVLSSFGYETAGFVANTSMLCPQLGLHRGFTHYECFTRSFGQIIAASALAKRLVDDKQLRGFLGNQQLLGRKTAAEVNQNFMDWLGNRDGTRPFFAFLNYFDAHDPYIPCQETSDRFGARGPKDLRLDGTARYADKDIVAFRDEYDRCVCGLDMRIGNLIERLKKRGHLDNTVVIVTSDHGEHFGEHGLMWHANSLYLPLLHVPLIILHNRGVPCGRLIHQPASLADLPATVMDLIGLGQERSFPGTTLRSLWQEPNGTPVREVRPVLSEVGRGLDWFPSWFPCWKGPMKSLVAGEYHYIRNGDGREELYNIEADPLEKRNLAGSAAARKKLEVLRASLDPICVPD
jgi:arylsulfatase A-like enzyme